MDIEGRSAVVTGGGSGIGRATAVALADDGATAVTIVDLDADAADETAQLVSDRGADAIAAQIDVGRPDDLARVIEQAGSRGDLGVVVNNAGARIPGADAPDVHFVDAPMERIDAVIAVNIGAVVHGTRAAVKAMADGGAVVNTASAVALPLTTDAARVTREHDPIYAATKAAVLMFTQSCAPLHRTYGVRVNAVVPGLVNTPMARTASPLSPSELERLLAEGKFVEPEEVAAAIVGLVMQDDKVATYVTVRRAPT